MATRKTNFFADVKAWSFETPEYMTIPMTSGTNVGFTVYRTEYGTLDSCHFFLQNDVTLNSITNATAAATIMQLVMDTNISRNYMFVVKADIAGNRGTAMAGLGSWNFCSKVLYGSSTGFALDTVGTYYEFSKDLGSSATGSDVSLVVGTASNLLNIVGNLTSENPSTTWNFGGHLSLLMQALN
jgi:hypothetical protein